MTRVGDLVAVAVPFVWLGMVLAISFLEAPLKFRAPGITTPLGLGIGRLVFHALNLVEAVLAAVLLVAGALGGLPAAGWALAGTVTALLAVQVLVVRRRLDRRVPDILAGRPVPPSHLHLVYVGLEAVKVLALPVLGAYLAAGAVT